MRSGNILTWAVRAVMLLWLAGCAAEKIPDPHERILATIGPATISLNEFIRRAEYTPRPAYCSGDNYIHKKIVLNSLIAEKLLALESGPSNELMANPHYQALIKGRREQAMRQWLYHVEGTQKAKIDSTLLKTQNDLAGRRYDVDYFTLTSDHPVDSIKAILRQSPEAFNSIYANFGEGVEPPVRQITWEALSSSSLRTAIFSEPLQVGEIVGPIDGDSGEKVFVRVVGWQDRVAVSDNQQAQRLSDVTERVTEAAARRSYNTFTQSVMRGKQVEFVDYNFWRLVEIFGAENFEAADSKDDAIRESIWARPQGGNSPDDTFLRMSDLGYGEPFFYVSGDLYTVGDFVDMVNSHPLMFRKNQINKREYAAQFKLAVIDLIRDQFLTEAAYAAGYDSVNVVRRNSMMWEDNLLSLFQKQRYLNSIGFEGKFSSEYLSVIENSLNPLIDSLQTHYSSEIEIDMDLFETVQLSTIDVMVVQPDLPYPLLVPNFPLLTTDSRIDYGSVMRRQN